MCSSFVHLHNHTEYSLLDGATRIPDMVRRAKENDMPAIAITDHGVMFGVMEFYFECIKQGIKPIIGMEAYVSPQGRFHRQGREEKNAYHLLLLARNQEGYRNLCKLHTAAALEGFYYRPRIDHDILREHAKGLIGTTTCLGSEVNDALLHGDYEKALKTARMYKEIFEEGCYFVELQDHRLEKQARCKEGLLRIAKELDLPLVATNDAHYLCKENYQAHDVLWCIGLGEQVDNPNRLRFENNDFYIKTKAEMEELFGDLPESLDNTLAISEMCNLELGKSKALMPDPDIPSGMGSREYLRHIAEKGVNDRIAKAGEREAERLNYELSVIEKTGFEDYFLLVREFANYSRDNGIAFGVRGSAAGSLVSYAIGITDVDPLEYDLTFERFLNIERIAMPDIDMDFEDARRDEVIRWVTEKYGKDRVAQIVTFGTLGAKAAIKDAGRVLGYAPAETDRICKTIPNVPGMNLAKALDESADFRAILGSDPRFSSLVDVAKTIEGTARHAGVHAAGVVISRDPLSDYIPLYRGNDGQPVTAFEMGILEKIGLLKMDFLGLSNLTVLAYAVDAIRKSHKGQDPGKHPILNTPIHEIALDDQKTFDMLSRGDTVGVFQLESGGMRRNIVSLKPQNVRELAAMVALFRPGPMEHIPRFIDTKFGRVKPEFLDERMVPILEETYGVIVYQDQVLKLVQALAGFSLGKADILRRAMGKKDKDAMDSMKTEFLAGTDANEIPRANAEKVWELLLPFAGYAFNKAHAVCYALIAYQTAYLKANYPTEYMAALLEVYRDKEDRVTAFIEECRRTKIAVLPPDINESKVGFNIQEKRPKNYEGAIRFGLAAIKGVGAGLVENMLKEREENGKFKHLYEFCERTRHLGLNKGSLEALIKAGALDGIDKNRQRLLDVMEGALIYADNSMREKLAGQDNLFGEANGGEKIGHPELPEKPMPTRSDLLRWEKEVMGIYVSDHPLRGLERAIRVASTHQCAQIEELEEGTRITLCGVISAFRVVNTKKGDKMGNATLEDFSGQAQCFIPPATFAKIGDKMEKDQVVTIKGVVTVRTRFNTQEEMVEVRIDDCESFNVPPEADLEDDSTEGTLFIQIASVKEDQLNVLRELIKKSPGAYRVLIEVVNNGHTKVQELLHRVDAGDEFCRQVEKCLIRGKVERIQSSRLVIDGATPIEAEG